MPSWDRFGRLSSHRGAVMLPTPVRPQVQAATAGGVDAIVQAMRLHEKRAPVQEWAVWALKETAMKSGANRALIGRSSGALRAAITAMRTHAAAVGVQDHACRLIAALCQSDADNCAHALAEGAVEAVVAAVVLQPLAQSVQQHGFAALAALAASGDAGLDRVRAARCLTTVLEGIERFPSHKGVQASGADTPKRAVGKCTEMTRVGIRGPGCTIWECPDVSSVPCVQAQGRHLVDILGPDVTPAGVAAARAAAAAAAALAQVAC